MARRLRRAALQYELTGSTARLPAGNTSVFPSTHTQRTAAMSIVSFIQDAGEKLFKFPGHAKPAPDVRPLPGKPAATASHAPSSAPADVDALNRSAADAIRRYLASKGLAVD